MIAASTALVSAGLVTLLLWCAWTDIDQRRISNAAVLCLVGLYGIAVATPVFDGIAWLAVALGGGLFVLGLLGFALGAVGGGDVKLAGALGLWAGSSDPVGFVLVTGLTGAGLSILILATRNLPFAHYLAAPLQAGPQTGGRVAAGESVPYGVALAAGGLWIAYGLIAA